MYRSNLWALLFVSIIVRVVGIAASAIGPFDLIYGNTGYGGFHDAFVVEPRQAEEVGQNVHAFNGANSNVTAPSRTFNRPDGSQQLADRENALSPTDSSRSF